MAMIFSKTNQRKYFPRIFFRRPVYTCLLLLLFLIASIIAEQVQTILLEKLENRFYKNQITPSDPALLFIISSEKRDNNEVDVFVTIAEPDYSKPANEFSYTPVETKKTIRPNETFAGIGLVRTYGDNRAINLYNSRSNKITISEFAKNLENELGGDLGLTPEEKYGLRTLLKTLTDDNKPD